MDFENWKLLCLRRRVSVRRRLLQTFVSKRSAGNYAWSLNRRVPRGELRPLRSPP